MRPSALLRVVLSAVALAAITAPAAAAAVHLDTRPGQQRVAVDGRELASSITEPPYTRLAGDAPALLAAVYGQPRSCRRTSSYPLGPVHVAEYERGRTRVRAFLAGMGCSPSDSGEIRRLDFTGSARVVTNLGRLRLGMRKLPRALRRPVPRTRDRLAAIPVQDPCAARPGVPLRLGREHGLFTVDLDHGRLTRVTVQVADPAQCLTQPSREAFTAAVLADPCLLVNDSVLVDGPCRPGETATVTDEPTLTAVWPSTPLVHGASGDGAVMWASTRWRAFIAGHGVGIDVQASEPQSPLNVTNLDNPAGQISEMVATGLAPSPQFGGARVNAYLTSVLRNTRRGHDDVVVGRPSWGADAQVWSMYRNGRRVGWASFMYTFVDGGAVYRLLKTSPKLSSACPPRIADICGR